jgi:predicted ester cyclase
MSQDNKELLRQFVKTWDAGDTESFGDFISADAVDHQRIPGMPEGLEGAKQISKMLRAAVPDGSTEVHQIIAEGDLVAALQTVRGTQTGELMGMPATGKSFEITGIDIVRVAGGKMVEHWGLTDQAGMMIQLGLMPLPPEAQGWRPPPTSPVVKGDGSGDPAAHRKAMNSMVAAMRASDLEKIVGRVASDAVDHAAMPGQPEGQEGFRWRFNQLFAGMTKPDFKVLASVGEGPYLSQAYSFNATHTGALMGIPPTNKSFTISAIDFVRFEDGKLREHWGLIDMPSMMMQLGLAPPPA